MNAATAYDAYLTILDDGMCLAQLCDLPGCYARGATPDAALRQLEAAIPAYFDWLRTHDDYTPIVHGPFTVRLAETQNMVPGSGAFFSPDAEPVSQEEYDWYLSLFQWAAGDLLALIRAAPGAPVERPHDGIFANREQLLRAGGRMLETLHYVLDQPDEALLKHAAEPLNVDWLAETVRLVSARVRAASPQERTRVIERDGSKWSLRRVLREMILVLRVRKDTLMARLTAS